MEWTRRKFLRSSASGPILLGTSAGLITRIDPAPGGYGSTAQTLESSNRDALSAALDEIIPGIDGMPSASEVGAMHYIVRLVQREPDVGKDVQGALGVLNRTSHQLVEKPFSELEHERRVQVLMQFEKDNPLQFAVLRDCIYEAYYTQPQVWKIIGYEFYPTDHAGPHLKPFDESILAEVRRKPRLYREA